VALRLEVVGPHERWVDDFHSELCYVRRHWRALTSAPPLCDGDRLPPLPIIKQCRDFNHAYQRCLDLRRQVLLYREAELTGALDEARRLCCVWSLMETAACPTQSWAYRRRALLALREQLGPEAYYSGEMPPCVPLWRFQDLDH
jgi:hypothetical protein